MDLESHVHRNGTRVIKFPLHLSKEKPRKRFLERMDEPDKSWKFSLADIHEWKYWKHSLVTKSAKAAAARKPLTTHSRFNVVDKR